MENKTNVMRILDKANVKYNFLKCTDEPFISAEEICKSLNLDPKKDFKTLVTIGKSRMNYVFCIPASSTLDLKKAAKVVNEKNIEMIPLKDLLKTTGYVHGGCSPIGMKKQFRTVFDVSAKNYETIFFSAGKINEVVEVKVDDIPKIIQCYFEDIVKENA